MSPPGQRPCAGRGPEAAGPGTAGPERRVALAVCLLLPAVAGCAETVTPTLGGLRVGMSGAAFRVPTLRNERPPFEYPRSAWEAGVGGETRLRLHITREGKVDTAYVLRSSGHPALDSAALAGARRLRYRPARHGEETVSVWAVLPVRYPMPAEVEEP